ncbi:hypothetical protein L1987_59380 [Smallanthus sonchifolius]|uniref:Uncharacterized protein n=1 Tax=Smallanthus sonchifolius TaxID=185202 RepID=A0ACB9D5C8_9ASTR|nr:hypothetical protein L1987_59380 [Smallanthus sonchifolius]
MLPSSPPPRLLMWLRLEFTLSGYQLLVWTLWFLLKLRLCYHDADTQGNSRRISCWKPTKGQGMYRYLARSSIEIAKIRMQFGAPIGLCNMGTTHQCILMHLPLVHLTKVQK